MSEVAVFEALKYRIEVDKRGTRRYFNSANQLHRTDGPAVESSNGHKEWLQNGLPHRADGPAIEWGSGTKSWCRNGLLHRTDGPAIEWYNGEIEWWINGKVMTEAEFNQLVSEHV